MKRYHHGNLRQALLDEAEKLLSRRGAGALTLREVAKAADVSHGAPYHHFASRETLLAALGERGFDALAGAMQATRGRTAGERLLAICEAYVSFAAKHPAVFRLMFGPLLAHKRKYPELKRAAERAFHLLLEASREVSPAEPLDLALAGWSLAHGLAYLSIDGVFDGLPVPVPKTPALERRLGEWIMRGVRSG